MPYSMVSHMAEPCCKHPMVFVYAMVQISLWLNIFKLVSFSFLLSQIIVMGLTQRKIKIKLV